MKKTILIGALALALSACSEQKTEKCIHIACILDMYGELTPKQIRKYGGSEDCGRILYFNAFKWFSHERKGVYSINDNGRRGLMEYPELERYYTEMLMKNNNI